MCPLPFQTKLKHKVSIFRLAHEDPSKYNVIQNFKMIFAMSDIRYITPDLEGLSEGEIGIMDFKGFSFRHFLKFASNLPAVRFYLKYVQEAVPFKIYQNHFVNCSPILTKMITLVRPFVKKELFDLMVFHTNGYETLYEHVPKEILPFEYGGGSSSFETLFDEWVEQVEKNREYLNNDSNWKV